MRATFDRNMQTIDEAVTRELDELKRNPHDEISEQMLPSAEPNERFFRLLLAVLESLREEGGGAVDRAVNYFSLWAVRLSGWLPELHACLA